LGSFVSEKAMCGYGKIHYQIIEEIPIGKFFPV
jgi:hypothetical protein